LLVITLSVIAVGAVTVRVASAATLAVTSVDDVDDGTCDVSHCSLREAINAANDAAGLDTIEFNIPGGAPFSIQLGASLPTITDPVVIDGTTQPGWAGAPVVEISGVAAGNGVFGLEIVSGGTTVRGLVINQFSDSGILLRGSGGNIIEGNYVGLDVTGTLDRGNGHDGIGILDSANNVIGGVTATARNVISGNEGVGVSLSNGGSTGNRIEGNYIGTDHTGTLAVGQTLMGVLITAEVGRVDYASDNTIGGVAAGAGNVISGNGTHGVSIFRGARNSVEGNKIGTDATGMVAVPNGGAGVEINEADDSVIGGTGLGAPNLISGNTGDGVLIIADGEAATGNIVQGNFIGTSVSGDTAVGNLDGVSLELRNATSSGSVSGNLIGGDDLADGAADGVVHAANVISGNGGVGVVLAGSTVTGNQVHGNRIGTTMAGDAGLGNQGAGVLLTAKLGAEGSGAEANDIGGTSPGAGNTISGNNGRGVSIVSGSTLNRVLGNRVGTDVDGVVAIPNVGPGVFLRDVSDNDIGGADPGAGNLISGNDEAGVEVLHADGNRIAGNRIGTTADGAGALGNGGAGIFIDESLLTVVGGTNAGAGNLISGNGFAGVEILADVQDATDNLVQGNLIGTDATGSISVGNGGSGVVIRTGNGSSTGLATQNQIGGADGDDGAVDGVIDAGNVISGNFEHGVVVSGHTTTLNRVEGNLVGTDLTGMSALANDGIGVLITGNGVDGGASSNVVGGVDAHNVISGNGLDGVHISAGASFNEVLGNLIGTNFTGTVAVGNGRHGVAIIDASDNTIDGTAPLGRSLISGNAQVGILLRETDGADAHRNKVTSSYIGTDIAGSVALPNGAAGVVVDGAGITVIGDAPAGGPPVGNLISGNPIGISLQDVSPTTIEANLIGTDAAGTAPIPNGIGISISGDVISNRIGGTSSVDQGNIISGNEGDGIRIDQTGSLFFEGAISAQTEILNNRIGVDAAGDPMGNGGHGVAIIASHGNRIGADILGTRAPNEIAHNGGDLGLQGHGVLVAEGEKNLIRFNSIHSNAGRGIDLGDDSWDVNDVGDVDTGANTRLNHPVVAAVEFTPTNRKITWFLFAAPNTTYDFDYYINTAPDPSGFGGGETHVFDEQATTGATGYVQRTINFLDSDRYVSVTVTDPNGNTSEFSMIDTDGDALGDAWETDGIDIDEDGVIDLDLAALGADPDHKDIFVEYDSMIGLAPHPDALDWAVNGRPGKNESFANVANELVQNPDGAKGVTLHLDDGGDAGIPRIPWPVLNTNGWPALFEPLKNGAAGGDHRDGTFGTPAERALANWPQIREARRLVYHYLVFAHSYGPTSSSGLADIRGPNIIVTLGTWAGEGANPFGGTREEQAGTIVHELGHNLVLGHGGRGDSTHYKPNYHSVMNYLWQTPKAGYASSWVLGYSHSAFPDIDEATIVEADGFDGHVGHRVPLGPIVVGGVRVAARLVDEEGPIDVNGDGDTSDTVGGDINFMSDSDGDGTVDATDASPGETLTGQADWSDLVYYFRESRNFEAAGSDPDATTTNLTLEDEELLESIGDGPGDFTFSHPLYLVDEDGSGAVVVRVLREAGTDGPATVDYVATAGTATPGDDFGTVSGTLTFGDAEYVATFSVPVFDDGLAEGPETIDVTLSNPTGGTGLGHRPAAVIEIQDNDATTFVVTNTEDDGSGSLRSAITNANAHPGLDVVTFAIPGVGVRTIRPLSQLPDITDPLIIDGYSQPGASPNTAKTGSNAQIMVELDGSLTSAVGLRITGGGSTVRGLAMNRWFFNTIELRTAGGNVIEGNFIGTDPTGMFALRPAAPVTDRDGIQVSSAGNRIGGPQPAQRNIVAGLPGSGIDVPTGANPTTGTGASLIQGNLIGVGADGTTPIGNDLFGVDSAGRLNVIGGVLPGEGNVIANNGEMGVYNRASTVRGNQIHSNTGFGIGVDFRAPTFNDLGDTDAYQNYPVLESAGGGIGVVTVNGRLDSKPDETFAIDFYASQLPHSSGYGEGAVYLGSDSVTTGPDGNTAFAINVPHDPADGRVITATVTNAAGSTSEFSVRIGIDDALSSPFVVTAVGDVDDGFCNPSHCSLREALHAANNHPGRDEIHFAIPGAGPHQIQVGDRSPHSFGLFGLPAIVDPVVIDGYTQPGASANTLVVGTDAVLLIELTGLLSDPFGQFNSHENAGLLVLGDDTTIRGLTINRFYAGIRVGDLINRNVLEVSGAVIAGNYLGTDPSGRFRRENVFGVFVTGGTVVGGTLPGDRNVASGNFSGGILTEGGTVQGNYVGLDAAGTGALGNGRGVSVNNAYGIKAGPSADDPPIIGGTAPGAGNVVSANRGEGIVMDCRCDGYLIQGNIVGLDATGTTRQGNHRHGIDLEGGTGLVGGAASGAGNVIAASSGIGIFIDADDNVIQGNIVGLMPDGSTSTISRNQRGILVLSSGNLIGGTGPGEGNRIGSNAEYGVAVGFNGNSDARNSILGNAIHGNGGLGIDLNRDGVTLNDPGDVDGGPNRRQNFPSIATAETAAADGIVTGTLESTPEATFRIEVFANTFADPSGFGEGEELVGFVHVTTDVNGSASFALSVPALTPGTVATATATGPDGSTSEFSGSVAVLAVSNLAPIANGDAAVTPGGVAVAIPVLDNDVDLDGTLVPGTVTVTSTPANGSATPDPATGEIVYHPAPGFEGSDGFSYTVEDDSGSVSNSAFVSITVEHANQPPLTVPDDATTIEDVAVIVDVLVNDSDPNGSLDPVTVTVVSGPASGTTSVNPLDGEITYSPFPDTNGIDGFSYTVADDEGATSAPTLVTVDVRSVNDAPFFVPGADVAVAQDAGPQTVAGWASGMSAGPANEASQALTFVVDANSDPGLFSAGPAVDAATGHLTFSPAAGASGVAVVELVLTDDGGTVDGGVDRSQVHTLTITLQAGGLYQTKEAIREALVTELLSGAVDRNEERRINEAIERIDKSLRPDRWVSDDRLDPKHGKKVFDEERKAVHELMKIDAPSPVVTDAIQGLTDIDEQLALLAVADATAAGGDVRHLQHAQRELDRATAHLAKGEYDKAIDRYRNAWSEAQKAMSKPGSWELL
jgi:CSLREA domain-containing protein